MARLLKLGLDREGFVKANLIQTLVDCVKELQLKYVAERSDSLVNDEATNSLCFCLEAMFIHGLKNPFLKSMSSVLNAAKENQVPQPSFWEFILIFCHQDVILQINALRLINTDIGRCRAWVRIVLNDGLLISYIQLILTDKKTLKEYYKPSAFLRDTERCDLAKSYLYGIESYNFQLACNSSLLNSWNNAPLSLVGLRTPPETITQGVDVAENMEAKDLQALPNLKLQSNSPPSYAQLPYDSGFGRAPLLEEDEALRLILSSRGPSSSATKSSPSSSSRRNSESELSQRMFCGVHSAVPPDRGNGVDKFGIPGSYLPTTSSDSLIRRHTDDGQGHSLVKGASNGGRHIPYGTPELNEVEKANFSNEDRCEEKTVQGAIPISPAAITPQEEEGSYAALFESYSRSGTGSVIGTPIGVGSPITIGSFLQSASFLPSRPSETRAQTTISASSEPSIHPGAPVNHRGSSTASDFDFEVVPNLSDRKASADDINPESFDFPMVMQTRIQTIPNETGLDAQNYRCKECNRPIGMLYGAARVCGFSGNYYCGDCHLNDESVIPSRILMNWDFTRFNVSRKARQFLNDISDKPIFDLNKINSKLYLEVEECGEILKLRTQLNTVAIYLLTCKDSLLQELLTKEFWMKEHIYQELHSYSLSDLVNIPNRQLITAVAKLVSTGEVHIKACAICRQKGFICEICRDAEVIFPFELDRIFRCSSCGAVYHNKCMNNNIQCPRCDRWKFQ